MIRVFDEPSGEFGPEFDPRVLFRTLEHDLSRPRVTGDEYAAAAQQLVYDAWEAASVEEQSALFFSALKLDPANVDALLQAGVYAGLNGAAEIEFLRNVVATGEKNLGKEFAAFTGHFWGAIETRPYMRARERLAEALRHAGRLAEAVAEWEGMLKLNPNDNQGIRYLLLPALLALGRLELAGKLFESYPAEEEFNTVFAWGRVLERFLSHDLPGAQAALAGARKQNPHTEPWVRGRRKPPKRMPAAYAPGSEDEAKCFADGLRQAWIKHPAALAWLETQPPK